MAGAVGMLQAAFSDQGRAADIAWAVGVPWQGQGIASEAARAVVGWLERRGVATITAHIHPDHHASATVATRAGLRPTGDYRNHQGIHEQPWHRQFDRVVVRGGSAPVGGGADLRLAGSIPAAELRTTGFSPPAPRRSFTWP